MAAEIAEQVKLLDGLVRYRFGDNAELMGASASARNVVGPFKAKGGKEGGGIDRRWAGDRVVLAGSGDYSSCARGH